MVNGRREYAVHRLSSAVLAPDGATSTKDAAEALGALPFATRERELTRRIHAYDPRADTALIDAAYVLASEAHVRQQRDHGDPSITHPLAVAEILAGYRLDTGSIVTGLLHDTIEDTGVKLPQIEQQFGPDVAGLVDGV